jgi:hypothetical protein
VNGVVQAVDTARTRPVARWFAKKKKSRAQAAAAVAFTRRSNGEAVIAGRQPTSELPASAGPNLARTQEIHHRVVCNGPASDANLQAGRVAQRAARQFPLLLAPTLPQDEDTQGRSLGVLRYSS